MDSAPRESGLVLVPFPQLTVTGPSPPTPSILVLDAVEVFLHDQLYKAEGLPAATSQHCRIDRFAPRLLRTPWESLARAAVCFEPEPSLGRL